MTFSNLSFLFRRMNRRSESRLKHRLLSVRQFQRLLARERARSDRSGDRFSLLVFSPQSTTDAPTLQLELIRSLCRRLRLTDEAGWFDRRRIGVVLPATPPRGAWKLADDVCGQWDAESKPDCKVYCYPSDSAQFDQSITHRRTEAKTSDTSATTVARSEAEALEPLFAKAMPLWKRSIDIFAAGIGLALLSPVLLVVALAIKLSSPGPVFFRQLRSGRAGRPFLMYKFRSMVTDAEARKAELMALERTGRPGVQDYW